MAKFNFVLNNKPSKSGKYAIMLRITIKKDRAFMVSGVELKTPTSFLPDGKNDSWVHSKESDYKKMNKKLKELKDAASDTYDELVKLHAVVTPNMVVEQMKPSSEIEKATEISHSFMTFAKGRTTDILNAGGFRNWKKYNCFFVKLEAFLKQERKKDLMFDEITPTLVSRFEAYLHTLKNERQPDKMLHPNYIQVLMKCFRAMYKAAMDKGCIEHPITMKAFAATHIETEKEKLNLSEIGLLKALALEEGSLIWHCRNAFLFSFYCAGIRAGDLLQLRWCNITSDGRLNYQMGKNHKTRDLVLVEQAADILKQYRKPISKATDYIFPFMDASKPYSSAITQEDRDTLPIELKKRMLNDMAAKNTLLNKYLKKMAEMAGIEKKLSMHISRHSFAKVAKEEGTDNLHLKELMAHSSIKVTETYMGSFDTQKTDEALQHIFSKKEEATDKEKLMAILEGMDAQQVSSLLATIQKQA